MSDAEYYSKMRDLAREKRVKYSISTKDIKISLIKRIYKQEGIKIDYNKTNSPKIRAAYFCEGEDCSIMLNKLPKEPKLFSLVHELKHHFVDRDIIENGEIRCGDWNQNELIEKGAEVFAAEFIFPESEMRSLVESLNINKKTCTEKSVVDIRRKSPVPISFTFIVKRLTWFGFIPPRAFSKIKFQNLEEKIYGKPFYKQPGFQQYRRNKKAFSQ